MKQFSVSDSQQTAPLFVRKTGHASFFSFFLHPPETHPVQSNPNRAPHRRRGCAEEIRRRRKRGKRAESNVINPTGPAESFPVGRVM